MGADGAPATGGRKSRIALSLAVLLTGLGAATVPAGAFELFGVTFFGSDEPEEPLSPDAQPYEIEVNVDSADEDLVDAIRSASALWNDREDTPPPSTAAFLSRTMAEYGRIVAALYAEGHYGGVVTIRVDGRDPATIEPDAVLPDPVPVAIDVEPGPLFAFGDVRIAGRAPAPADEDDLVEATPEDLGLLTGGPARSGIVLGSERSLVEAWRQQGYPKAEIAERTAVANHPTDRLDVSITARSGPHAVYGPVTTTGTERMDPDFVAWMTGIRPGTEYDPDDLDAAVENLRRLQVFASQRIVEADAVGADGTLPLTVNVAERPLRVFGVGASYSTEDGAGVEGYWQHRNLFGRAERLRFEGRVSGISSTDPTDFSYRVATLFTKPGILTPLTDLTAELSAQREVLDTYTDNTIRARVGLAHQFYDDLTGTIAVNLEATAIEDNGVTDEFLIASLPATLTYDGRDDELNPTRGIRAVLGLEPLYEAVMENPGVIGELEASTYVSFTGDDRIVLAARGAIGSIVGPPQGEFPQSRRFFVGGGGSVRGYGYRNVGPRGPDGQTVGGRSYLEASLELRAKVTESIGVVPFLDMGAAYASPYPDFESELRFGAGVGIRYDTGLGPIRVDAAVPLNPGPDDPSFAIYVGLGQSF